MQNLHIFISLYYISLPTQVNQKARQGCSCLATLHLFKIIKFSFPISLSTKTFYFATTTQIIDFISLRFSQLLIVPNYNPPLSKAFSTTFFCHSNNILPLNFSLQKFIWYYHNLTTIYICIENSFRKCKA